MEPYRPKPEIVAAMGDPNKRRPALTSAAQTLDLFYQRLRVPLRDRQAISRDLMGHARGTTSARSEEQMAATVDVAGQIPEFAIEQLPQRREHIVFIRLTPTGHPIRWKL